MQVNYYLVSKIVAYCMRALDFTLSSGADHCHLGLTSICTRTLNGYRICLRPCHAVLLPIPSCAPERHQRVGYTNHWLHACILCPKPTERFGEL